MTKILLTGANGYIGKRLLPILVNKGYEIICLVRDKNRFNPPYSLQNNIIVFQADLLDKNSLLKIPKDIDGAYYLVHSMSSSKNYEDLEILSAVNFREIITKTNVKHVVYLSGIINEQSLSRHLASRKAVEDELAKGSYKFTTLRAGIIIGSGSASFEIIRDLVEKLPVMVAPRWLKTKCQPIGINDVIKFLEKILFKEITYQQYYDIGGTDVLSYKDMLLVYAKIRKLKRKIFIVPVMTPKLSSYWLYFITAISFKLATALVNSMKVEVVCSKNNINEILNIIPQGYENSLKVCFSEIEENQIISSWKDSFISGRFNKNISEFINTPTFGCFVDKRNIKISNYNSCINKIWNIGGENGWYYANFLWKIRGFIDKLSGGVGLRRGRTGKNHISPGDAIDFWRVLYSNKQEGRLLLYAEMKLPGDAWLEFNIKNNILYQTATFRPKGLWGRIYWYLLLPIHNIIFKGMIKSIA